jgi:predicted DNA-binding protein YlxM (UPF0122 family)
MGRPKKVQQLDNPDNPATIDESVDRINLVEALQLRFVNKLTYRQIADKYGVSPQAIEQRISRFKEKFGDSQEMQSYTSNRDGILTVVERELLSRIVDPSKLEKATVNNLAYAFQQIFNARRLEEGKSTANLQGIYDLVLQLDREERKQVQTNESEVIDV